MTTARQEWVTARDITELWPDVSPALLRIWLYRGYLDVARTPAGQPIRLKGANVYRWADVVEAERRARMQPRGRKRAC